MDLGKLAFIALAVCFSAFLLFYDAPRHALAAVGMWAAALVVWLPVLGIAVALRATSSPHCPSASHPLGRSSQSPKKGVPRRAGSPGHTAHGVLWGGTSMCDFGMGARRLVVRLGGDRAMSSVWASGQA